MFVWKKAAALLHPGQCAIKRSYASASRKWDPSSYLSFENERIRPAIDLLGQIPNEKVASVADLGCGTGNMAPYFRRRWPNCEIYCIDNSSSMLDRAKQQHQEMAQKSRGTEDEFVPDQIHYFEAEFDAFAHCCASSSSAGSKKFDVIFSNAALQWASAGQHAILLPHFLQALRHEGGGGGGTFAFQMPDTRMQPSHLLMRTAAAELGLTRLLAEVRTPSTEEEPLFYYRLLRPHCSKVNLWSTTFCHWLEGENPVADFFASSGLGAYMDKLEGEEKQAFVERYRELVARAYPKEKSEQGKQFTLLSLKRFFCVATL